VKTADVLARAVATLKASPSIDHWQRDREEIEADDLLCYALGVDEVDPDDDVPAPVVRRFHRMVDRRATGEPVQLIKGFAVFRGLEVLARPGVFVPRDSTEFLAEQAIRRLRRRQDPVASTWRVAEAPWAWRSPPRCRISRLRTDISADAIQVARLNARRLELANARFLTGDLFGALSPTLARNRRHDRAAPSIRREAELRELPTRSPLRAGAHSPITAPTDSPVGRAAESDSWLKRGGWLLIEVSPDRARSVAKVLRDHGFADVRSTVDSGFKVTRVLVGRRP
jgi:release factor glutamine methyltransferase